MAMESTILPVPSELVMPPAAFWAAQGHMSFWGVVWAGTLGSYFGSAASYLLFRWLGDQFLSRFARYLFLNEKKIRMAQKIVAQHGAIGIFISRLLPVVRHLISIPAGIFKMSFLKFSTVTLLGSGLWCYILSWWGARVIGAHPSLLDSPTEMMRIIRVEMAWFVAAIFGFAVLYAFVVWYKRRANSGPVSA